MDRPIHTRVWTRVLLASLTLVFSDPAWSCAVCGGGPLDATSDVFIGSTIVLSLVPLCAMGGLIYLLVKSYRKQQVAVPEGDSPEEAPLSGGPVF